METITTNIADMCAGELDEAIKLLEAAKKGYPEDFDLEGVQFFFNRNSGDLFLINKSYQLCVAIDGKLHSYYFLSGGGKEGTIYELIDEYTKVEYEEDREYIQHIVTTFYNNEFTLPKLTKDGEWVEYGKECFYIDEAEKKVVEFDWHTIDRTDNERTTIEAYASYTEAEDELEYMLQQKNNN